MEIKEAQKKVDEVIKEYGGYWEPLSMMARITEEIGELARALNLKHGGKRSKFDGDGRDVEEELSDIMFTLLAIANSQEIELEKEFVDKIEKDFEKIKKVYEKDRE